MSTYIDDLNQAEVASSLEAMRHSSDGQDLIVYAGGDERFALYLLLLGRVLTHISALHTEYETDVWRGLFQSGYSPNDAAYEVYGEEILRWV